MTGLNLNPSSVNAGITYTFYHLVDLDDPDFEQTGRFSLNED